MKTKIKYCLCFENLAKVKQYSHKQKCLYHCRIVFSCICLKLIFAWRFYFKQISVHLWIRMRASMTGGNLIIKYNLPTFNTRLTNRMLTKSKKTTLTYQFPESFRLGIGHQFSLSSDQYILRDVFLDIGTVVLHNVFLASDQFALRDIFLVFWWVRSSRHFCGLWISSSFGTFSWSSDQFVL